MDMTAQVLGTGTVAKSSDNPTPNAPASGQTQASVASDPATGDVKASQSPDVATPAPAMAPSIIERLNTDEAQELDMRTRMTAVETRLAGIIEAHNAREAAASATNGTGIVTPERFGKLVRAIFGSEDAI